MSRQGTTSRGLPPPGMVWGLLFLSAGTLLFEITLTRIFSVAQFYHFAFMIISLAMLGFGASGAVLARFPGLARYPARAALFFLSLAYGGSSVAGYGLTNLLPFDSFSIAWDTRQVWILILHYWVLALPFFCSGAALGLLFVHYPDVADRLYAVNFAGSALGCALALVVPLWRGGEGAVLLSGALGAWGAVCFAQRVPGGDQIRYRIFRGLAALAGIGLILLSAWMPDFLVLRLSPYKGLSYALQYPGAQIIFQRWNSFSRVDLVESAGIRLLPGLSYRYEGALPSQRGLFVDGDDPSPVLHLSESGAAALTFTDFLPTAIAYRLREGGEALVLEPRGGLEIWTSLAQGMQQVTAVEPNALIVNAAGGPYEDRRVTTVTEAPRSFVRRIPLRYDVLTLALTTPYHPIRSGAYSLAENYTYTVEAFRDALAALKPGGILVATRWLQTPPSESLRAFALVVTAVEGAGGDPGQQIVAFRGYATLTLLVKNEHFVPDELGAIRDFAAARAFDLVWMPDLRAGEVNRYNVLSEPYYAQAFAGLLGAPDRAAWYRQYPFDVTPPTDDHPFFGHFFKGSQAPQVLAELGKSWQPFGGAGYFVLVVLLALAVGAALPMVLLPWVRVGRALDAPLRERIGILRRTALYFGLLGLGYLFVELPLMQQFILFLGNPAYALTTVLFALLLFSGVGSLLSSRFSVRAVLLTVVGMALAYAFLFPSLSALALSLSWGWRLLIVVLLLAPAAIPWAWGVNGAASVVASVLAGLLALSVGFRWVLAAGALCYAAAGWGLGYGWGAGSWMPAPVKGTNETPPRL